MPSDRDSTRGTQLPQKSEIRISKSETNSKSELPKPSTGFEAFELRVCFGFRDSDSDFARLGHEHWAALEGALLLHHVAPHEEIAGAAHIRIVAELRDDLRRPAGAARAARPARTKSSATATTPAGKLHSGRRRTLIWHGRQVWPITPAVGAGGAEPSPARVRRRL